MPFWRQHRLAVALTCADWRLHHPRVDLYKRLCRSLHVDGLDVAAVPGPDGLLDPGRAKEWAAVTGWIRLLITAHKPVKVVIVAHQRCAGHPVSDEQHEHDVFATAVALKERTDFGGPVIATVATFSSDARWGLKDIWEPAQAKAPKRLHA